MIFAINPPVWHYPQTAAGKIIIAIDRQKTWERVSDYRDRVVDLFLSQKMSEKYDQRFMCRVFLGGLRPRILNVLLKNESYFMFKSVSFHAELLELIQRDEGPTEKSDDEPDDVGLDEDSGEESWCKDVHVEGVFSQSVGGDPTMADHPSDSGDEPDDGVDEDSGEESGCKDVHVEGVFSQSVGEDPAMADHYGGNNGGTARSRPAVVQDGEVYFGEPNKKIDKLYNARYVLVLYR